MKSLSAFSSLLVVLTSRLVICSISSKGKEILEEPSSIGMVDPNKPSTSYLFDAPPRKPKQKIDLASLTQRRRSVSGIKFRDTTPLEASPMSSNPAKNPTAHNSRNDPPEDSSNYSIGNQRPNWQSQKVDSNIVKENEIARTHGASGNESEEPQQVSRVKLESKVPLTIPNPVTSPKDEGRHSTSDPKITLTRSNTEHPPSHLQIPTSIPQHKSSLFRSNSEASASLRHKKPTSRHDSRNEVPIPSANAKSRSHISGSTTPQVKNPEGISYIHTRESNHWETEEIPTGKPNFWTPEAASLGRLEGYDLVYRADPHTGLIGEGTYIPRHRFPNINDVQFQQVHVMDQTPQIHLALLTCIFVMLLYFYRIS